MSKQPFGGIRFKRKVFYPSFKVIFVHIFHPQLIQSAERNTKSYRIPTFLHLFVYLE
mgnify:FL=1